MAGNPPSGPPAAPSAAAASSSEAHLFVFTADKVSSWVHKVVLTFGHRVDGRNFGSAGGHDGRGQGAREPSCVRNVQRLVIFQECEAARRTVGEVRTCTALNPVLLRQLRCAPCAAPQASGRNEKEAIKSDRSRDSRHENKVAATDFPVTVFRWQWFAIRGISCAFLLQHGEKASPLRGHARAESYLGRRGHGTVARELETRDRELVWLTLRSPASRTCSTLLWRCWTTLLYVENLLQLVATL